MKFYDYFISYAATCNGSSGYFFGESVIRRKRKIDSGEEVDDVKNFINSENGTKNTVILNIILLNK